ncbi:ROK family protein [Jeotgalibaca sp. MA1X17-3]|uniref:ROK family protein n=1 Tax=Jeotgalibaca sp. MA1X17-3 TaxID=2908211 RepID=UPI001F3D07D4|nr:ROK family protein [Jeotgalibaca sp. MA1X17-3]UJF16107.1 ROK family protein [Jeotgalibaca sp. MA1X17-3]
MTEQYGSIEAGGTKFVLAIGNKNLEIMERISIPTSTPSETIPKIIEFFKKFNVCAIGLGCFGPIDLKKDSPTYGYITNTPKIDWQMFDIVGVLEKELAVPILFTTDVNAACYGEYVAGAAKGLSSCVYYTIGTGIGAGAMNMGEFVEGFSHPEMGHMIVRKVEADTYEGNCPFHRDCLEGLAAGPAIEKRTGIKGQEMGQDDPTWDFVADYLAQAIYNTTLILSPEKIILGGGVIKQPQLLPKIKEKFKQLLNEYVSYPHIDEYLVLPTLGDNPGTIGCLALAKKKQTLSN